jgi:phage tail sheath protein FI
MPTYKTPDVYVEEVSIFPPSVAEVETAVPCFIGYTRKATEISEDDLLFKAQKIKSMVDFKALYGGGPDLDPITVTMEDTSNKVKSVSLKNDYYLFDSLNLFFANGGGNCYIIAVGNFSATPSKTELEKGLEVLKKVDEPTMILMPDAAGLGQSDLYMVQQKVLKQCADLGDRVAILDLKQNTGPAFDHDDAVEEFRNKIGINNLKYGAAYTPWLKSALPKVVSYKNIVLKRGAATIEWDTLSNDRNILQLIANLELLKGLKSDVETKITGDVTTGSNTSLEAEFRMQLDTESAFLADPTKAKLLVFLVNICTVIKSMAEELVDYRENETLAPTTDPSLSVQAFTLRTAIDDIIDVQDLKEVFQELVYHSTALATTVGEASNTILSSTSLKTAWSYDDAYPPAAGAVAAYDAIEKKYSDVKAGTLSAGDKRKEYGKLLKANAAKAFDTFNQAIKGLLLSVEKSLGISDELLADSFSLYKTVVSEVKKELVELPPSGAIAGIYAMVDRTRGVHKAPANVSLNSVTGLSHQIDSSEQEGLNVDTNAGKSVNAIRAFVGKGILVWGARTLAGNDNEWRYIPVRRFFNMVEESVKKSTYWAVFEPNDANLWAKVKGMIDNYLFLKWRDGALAGAVPKDAYFVKVGLGLTMTPQDILEGRLIVEIGMAVVRPAEFIILRFSHKMQES